MLQVYAEYQRTSQVCSVAEHIKGVDNKIVYDISQVQLLFKPKKLTYMTFHSKFFLNRYVKSTRNSNFGIFLYRAKALSQICSTVSSNFSTERLTMLNHVEHCVRVASVLSNSTTKKKLMEIFSIRKKGQEQIAHQKLLYTMTMYAFELASGDTIQGGKLSQVRSKTIYWQQHPCQLIGYHRTRNQKRIKL